MTKVVKNINEKISEALVGMDPTVQLQIDQTLIDLDKTEKKVYFLFLSQNSGVVSCSLYICF